MLGHKEIQIGMLSTPPATRTVLGGIICITITQTQQTPPTICPSGRMIRIDQEKASGTIHHEFMIRFLSLFALFVIVPDLSYKEWKRSGIQTKMTLGE
jgi:hypothetical protein